ncbi:MAG: hypothetical protein ABII00_13890 [Elusimicrobiota bacterium]
MASNRLILRLLLWLLPLSAAAQEQLPFALPDAPVSSPAVYTADYFEYEGSTTGADARILLRGDVELKESTWTLRAGELRLDMTTRRGRAKGGFELDDGLTVLRGESGTFDLGDHSGSVEDVRAEYPPWRIWGREGSLDAQRKGHFRKAVFTSCDASPPHYYFRASGVHVKPHKWIYATNVRFHVGKAPLFYTPFLWKSLRARKLIRTRMTPGYDRRNGASVRTNTQFNLTRSLFGKLFLDYYGAQGPAVGSELGYRPSEDERGALYGYRIREKRSGLDRWTVLGSHYQAIGSSFAVQGRLQAQSDPEVNNHYIRSNAFRVTAELVNGAALVRRTAQTMTRIAYSRLDARDPSGNRFIRTKESLPRVDFRTAPLAWRRLPALVTLNAFADNSFERDRGFQQRSVGTGFQATQTLNLKPGLSLTPRAGFREVYEDKREAMTSSGSTDTLRDAFTGFYDLGTNLRVDTPLGDWDVGYAFERRFKPGTVREDVGAPDYGIESNLVSLQNTLRPSRRVLFRVGTGYDFRTFRTRTVGFRRRVRPVTADLMFIPRRELQISLRDEYQLEEGNRAFLFQTDWGERGGTFAGFGVTHTLDRAGQYLSALELGWAPRGSAWGVAGALRQLARTPGGFDLRGFQVFEKELSMTRDFHDFHTRALVRFRPGGVKEVLLRLELRTDHPVVRRAEKKDWPREWFPWRKGRTDDDRE